MARHALHVERQAPRQEAEGGGTQGDRKEEAWPSLHKLHSGQRRMKTGMKHEGKGEGKHGVQVPSRDEPPPLSVRGKAENRGHMSGTMLGAFYNPLIPAPTLPQEGTEVRLEGCEA